MSSAPDRAATAKVRLEQEYFCFRVGELRLGVPSENVREVVRVSSLTPLPRAPAFVLGVTSHRGEVLPVMDLLRFLGKGEARLSDRTRLFVGLSGTYVCAVVTDAVVGLRRFAVSDILPAPMGGDSAAEHLTGVVQDPSGLWSLLNLTRLLSSARQRAVAR